MRRRLKKKVRRNLNRLLIFIFIVLVIYTISTFFMGTPSITKLIPERKVDIKLSKENIYLAIDEKILITSSYEDVTWSSKDENIATVDDDGNITGISKGTTTIEARYRTNEATLTVNVTDLITKPTVDNKKKYLKCKQYNEEDAAMLDTLLEYRVNEAGIKTRAGVVAAARFLVLEFPYRIHYFYENGRLLTNNERPYVDGEGRYYHKGLYLTEDKFTGLKKSMHGPATWGCNLYSRITKGISPNGLDCSGYVSWALLNGGFDVGDGGAGINLNKDNDLDDLGEKLTISKENLASKKFKVGDLMSRYGHIGIIIGIDKDTYYIAESLDYNLHVLTMSESELLASDWKYIILMEDLYKEDGNLNNMW